MRIKISLHVEITDCTILGNYVKIFLKSQVFLGFFHILRPELLKFRVCPSCLFFLRTYMRDALKFLALATYVNLEVSAGHDGRERKPLA